MDNESEKIVQEALNRAAEGRTTLIIAHRLSTIQHADRIIVIEKGVVVEEGNHETLMQNENIYFKYVEQQRESQDEDAEVEHIDTTMLYPQQGRNSVTSSIINNHIVDDNKEITKIVTSKQRNIVRSLLKINKPEWFFIAFGCLVACINGTVEPLFCVIQTKLATVSV